jgi:DsbC/DsbD-like thiol-disulfide interchange protein
MDFLPRTHRLLSGGAMAVAVLLMGSITDAQPALARRAGAPHVTVELIADRDHARSGTQWLGLRFIMEPGWHIYWQNPGDSGEPPEVQWRLPSGMMASPVEWPAPRRIDVSGLINYGYQNTVVLPVRLAIAADVPTSPAVLRATLRWLACRDLCVSGAASIALTWPLDDRDRGAVASWGEAIARARALVPRPAPPVWKCSAVAGNDVFTLDVITGQRETAITFFPLEVNQIDDSAPQALTSLPRGIRLGLRKSAQWVKDPTALRGVVSFPDGRAFEITAPVSR